MATLLSDELRLGYVITILMVVMAGTWRIGRRFGDPREDWLGAACDALLGTMAVIYLSVGVPGVLGVLYPWVMGLVALALGVALFWGGRKTIGSPATPADQPSPLDRWIPAACLLLLLGYLAVLVNANLYVPVMSIDALVYHFPAPAQWLQQRHMGLFPVWYQPANAYSPLAGSTFIAWLMGIMGNDVLARFVQMPALVLLFLATAQVAKAAGAGRATAALLACGVVLSRPFISHAALPKDDLFASALFMVTVASLTPAFLRQPLGSCRVGIALGLFLAVKFTVLLSLPVLLLAIDAPVRAGWRWRSWGIAGALVILLAGPWYLRNWLMQGNPLFPITLSVGGFKLLGGLFGMQRTLELSTWSGVAHTLMGGYHSPPRWLALLWGCGWVVALALTARRLAWQPLLRLCLLGPLLGVGLFLWRAMYAEVRFVYPSLLLLTMAWAIALAAMRLPHYWQILIAALVALAGITTGFVGTAWLPLLLWAMVLAAAGMGLLLVEHKLRQVWPPAPWALAGLTALVLAMAVYVQWEPYVYTYQKNPDAGWQMHYGPIAQAWDFVRTELPPTAPLALVNTSLSYPLQGFHFQRPVFYVPSNSNLPDFAHLPPLREHLKGEDSISTVAGILAKNPDRTLWLKRLTDAHVQYLLVAQGSDEMGYSRMESRFADTDRTHFRRLFANSAAVVYQFVP